MYGDDALKLILESKRSIQTATLAKHNDPLVRQVCYETREIGNALNAVANEWSQMQDNLPTDPSQQAQLQEELLCKIMVRQLSANRNKRCLLAYHAQRLDLLKDMYWNEAGGALAHLLNTKMTGRGRAKAAEANDDSAIMLVPEEDDDVDEGPAGDNLANKRGDSRTANAPPVITDDVRSRLSPQETDFLRDYNELILDYKSEFLDVLDLTSSIARPPTIDDLYVDVRVVRDCGTVYTELGQIEFRKGQRYMVRRSDIERLIIQGYLEEV
jgi:GINS complex subunit 1